MALDRRDFARTVAGALAGLALPAPLLAAERRLRSAAGTALPSQETFFQWSQLRPGVHVAMGGGGNTILYRGQRGALQSDSKNFGLGRSIRREAESFGVPVTHFVNTHHHGDHSGGNEGFYSASSLAHENAEPRILATAEANLGAAAQRLERLAEQLAQADGPAYVRDDVELMRENLDQLRVQDFAPDWTFSDEAEISVDGLPVQCRWVSRGHTDGDNFVFLPQANVLHCGDLFFHGRHPYVDDGAGATPAGWITCVDAMLALCDDETVVVPGHGEITDRNGLQGQKAYFQRLQRMVETAMREGRSRDEIVAQAPDDLAALTGADRHLPRNLGIVYDEMAS